MNSRPDILINETAVTIRTLRHDPGFLFVSILLIALGTGLTSAIFTLLWQVAYAQLPVPDPTHLFSLHTSVAHMGRSDSDVRETVVSAPMYRYLSQHIHSASGVVARHGQFVNVDTPDGARHLRAELVSGNFFDIVGLKPVFGRSITESDNELTKPSAVAVLSYDFWQNAYGGQIGIWNSSVRLNGVPFRIVGIAPRSFNGLVAGQAPQIYMPLSALPLINPGWNGMSDWSLRWLNIFFRLPSATRLSKAEAELNSVYRAATGEELSSQSIQSADYLRELAQEQIRFIPASQGIHGMLDEWQQPLRILQCLTVAVLLLTCINLTGLVLVRSLRQEKELVVRYALGASRRAVIRLHLIQTSLLAIAGGSLGFWLAHVSATFLLHLQHLDKYGSFAIPWNGYSLAFHWLSVLVSALLVCGLPAWHAARFDLSRSLADSAVTHSSTRTHARTRRTLAALQIALSLALLLAAGLFAKSLSHLLSVPLGFNPKELFVFSLDPKLSTVNTVASRLLYSNIRNALLSVPGVQAVTYGSGGPFPSSLDSAVLIPSPGTGIRSQASAALSMVGPKYFSTLAIPVKSGREFDDRDRANTPIGLILNQAMAHRLFGEHDPVGLSVTMWNGLDPKTKATIVGVVADTSGSWKRSGMPLIYTAAQQAPRVWELTFYTRSTAKTGLSEPFVSELVRRYSSSLAPYDIGSMSFRMAEFASQERTLTLLIESFAGLALLISLIGIYGVVAYATSLRTGEFGVRLALGAQRENILFLVLKEAGLIICCGLLLAIPACFASLSLIRPQISNVSLYDPAILSGCFLTVVACSLLAALIPARHAARLDIYAVLRRN